ncbi:MAG: zinc ribbon domain-containing protein [Treponema sp.]|jgi:putative FmdB family regulatory protein|nr:zinc ribbon domain-containing protein [Treponema sp.]
MPTYEYECKDCGHTFEAFQSMSDEPIKICPLCGKSLRRLIHGGTGVIFKGSGFYVTDRGKSPSGSKDPSGAKDGAKKSGADAKPETAAGKADGASSSPAPSGPASSGGSPGSGGAAEGTKTEKKANAS